MSKDEFHRIGFGIEKVANGYIIEELWPWRRVRVAQTREEAIELVTKLIEREIK